MKTLSAIAAALVLAGCVSTPNVPPMQYFVLGNGQESASARPASQRSGGVLLLQPTSVSTFYDTQRLVFSRAEGQRAYYQFASWTDRPGRAFSELLSRRLGAPFTTSGIKGDLILHTRLEELYHDAAAGPGAVKIEVSAELVDATGRLVRERQRFARSVRAGSENAAGAVEAANRAVSEVLDDIAAWIEGSRPRPAANERVSGRSP
jgi:cholesterol transport system auxiliary component